MSLEKKYPSHPDLTGGGQTALHGHAGMSPPSWFGNSTYQSPFQVVVKLLSGAGAGQWTYGSSYTPGTRVLSFAYPIVTAPDSTTHSSACE